jgi:hypothetical protein
MQENVVRVYDKTTLDAAYYDDKIKTPKTAAELSPDKKSKKGLFIKLGATAASLLVAASAVFVGVSSANNEAPKSEPVAEAPADPFEVPFGEEPVAPVENETTPEEPAGFEVFGLPTVAELEVNAEQTDEEIAQDLISVISQWGMTGANREMMEYQTEGDNGYLGLSEFVAKVGEQVNPVFEEALYGENVSNPEFQEAISQDQKQHAEILAANYQTYGTQNEEPYFQKLNFTRLDGAYPNDDGSTTLFIGVVREDNGDENIVAGSGNGYEMEATLVINKIDGKVKIVQPPTYVAN